MHKICEGRTVLEKETILRWREETPDFRGLVTDYLCDQMMFVRANIDKILHTLGLPRKYIAQTVGLDVTHLSLWFNSKERNLSPAAIASLASAINCTCSELIMGERQTIQLPKRPALLYKQMMSSGKAAKAIEQMVFSAPGRQQTTPTDLIYERLEELATDRSMQIDDMMEPCKPEYRLNVKQILREKSFIARLPALFGICTLMDISPDFLLLQDYTTSPITADGKKVDDKYARTLGRFLTLTSDEQDRILAEAILLNI